MTRVGRALAVPLRGIWVRCSAGQGWSVDEEGTEFGVEWAERESARKRARDGAVHVAAVVAMAAPRPPLLLFLSPLSRPLLSLTRTTVHETRTHTTNTTITTQHAHLAKRAPLFFFARAQDNSTSAPARISESGDDSCSSPNKNSSSSHDGQQCRDRRGPALPGRRAQRHAGGSARGARIVQAEPPEVRPGARGRDAPPRLARRPQPRPRRRRPPERDAAGGRRPTEAGDLIGLLLEAWADSVWLAPPYDNKIAFCILNTSWLTRFGVLLSTLGQARRRQRAHPRQRPRPVLVLHGYGTCAPALLLQGGSSA